MRRVRLDELPEEGVSHDPELRKRVLLRRGAVPRLTAFSRAVLRPGQATTAHAHADMHEVFWVEAGRGEARVGGEALPLEPGVCLLVEPGEEHALACAGPEDLVLLYFGVEG
ncbi:MAG: cupin domain-containing protein [Gemmatimonadota bacterium]